MRAKLKRQVGVFLSFVLAVTTAGMSQAKSGSHAIESRFGEVDGIKIHYLTGGHGPAVILLHGYTQTSRMWRPLIPRLTDKFTVVAPDLPGIGDSDIPKDGLDMKTAAIRIHALVKSLGISKARVVGHDIGLMVAYAYAAQFPSEVEKLVVMDAFLPGVPGWELAYDSPNYWHFRFHGPTPEALVQGREKIYFAYFWNDLAADGTRSLPEADRASYVAAYSRPGRMRAGWAYFASWPDTAKDFAQMAQTQLTMPVLSIAGEKASAAILSPQMKRVATDIKVIELKGSGHWLMEERPQETMDALVQFLWNLTASTGTLTNPFQFTGRDNDLETGLYYYRARYFDPKVGRFISEDPLGIRDNLNMYLYVHNNPTNFDDPFGLYQTRGFPADKQVELANAINEALAKLRNTCPSCAGADGPKIANAIENATFVYKPKMKPKICGETGFFSFIGLRHEIGLGPSAFGPGCCSLASTVAHEAVHLTHGGENAAYGLEKKCFGCGN